MDKTQSRSSSYGPYGCLLFLMGLVFLVAGVASGMVPNALSDILTQQPGAGGSLQALAIWGLFTLGSLGLGSFGIRYYGIRNSTLGFGIILILCGIVGFIVYFSGGDTSHSGNAIWVVMNFVAEMVGSLLIASFGSTISGVVLVLIVLLYGEFQKS
jgi:hypothetical protein